jgi:hypothetical protein
MSAAPLFAACSLPLSVTPSDQAAGIYRLSWPAVSGAKQYEIQVSLDSFVHTTTLGTVDAASTGVTITQKTSRPFAQYSYRVTASNPSNPVDIECIGTKDFSLGGSLTNLARKTVIPVAGSVHGANNSDFKTSLRLGPATRLQSGKIIFHPAGQPGSENDPSIDYNMNIGTTLQYDDIVGAIGQSGIGSIDIISTGPYGRFYPLFETVPAEVRVFNQAADGTYGAFESVVEGSDAFRPGDWSVFVPSSRFRVNVGVRTITPAHAVFSLVAKSGTVTTKALDMPGDYLFMQAADQFFGVPVQPGDQIVIHFEGQDTIAIPFHTFTDNSTNDPAIFNLASPPRILFPEIDVVSISGV